MKKVTKKPAEQSDRTGREVFCRFIRKNGKIIYPKGKVFHFWVKG